MYPDAATYYANRSACYIMLENYTKALMDARTAVNLDPGFEKAYVRIAKCCLAKGDITGTEQAIKKIKEINANSTSVNSEKQQLQNLKQLEATIESNYQSKAYRNVVFYLDSAIKISPASFK